MKFSTYLQNNPSTHQVTLKIRDKEQTLRQEVEVDGFETDARVTDRVLPGIMYANFPSPKYPYPWSVDSRVV